MKAEQDARSLCPSASPEMGEASAFAILTEGSRVRVGYLRERIDAASLALPANVEIAAVFRLSAKCMGGRCANFESDHCALAARIVEHLEPVVTRIPPCAIRSECRWWREKGSDACIRCPQIITRNTSPTSREIAAAGEKAAFKIA